MGVYNHHHDLQMQNNWTSNQKIQPAAPTGDECISISTINKSKHIVAETNKPSEINNG